MDTSNANSENWSLSFHINIKWRICYLPFLTYSLSLAFPTLCGLCTECRDFLLSQIQTVCLYILHQILCTAVVAAASGCVKHKKHKFETVKSLCL